MPRRAPVDQTALADVLQPGRSVASHRELRAIGVPSSTITRRIRRRGPWQRVLPGVVAGHSGILTTHERRLGALKYAGQGSALTGLDALEQHGVRLGQLRRGEDRVHVLVPHASQKGSHGFAVVTRSRRPAAAVVRKGLPCVPAARAVIDACRRSEDLSTVRELVAAVVQQGFCTVHEVVQEVLVAQRQRTALAREVLAEVAAGVRSVAEARLRSGFDRYGVPQPEWNRQLLTPDGELIAVLDGLWERYDAALEINSVEWHLRPRDFRSTTKRQRTVVISGKVAISVLPSEIDDDLEGVCREVLQFLRTCAAMQGRAAS